MIITFVGNVSGVTMTTTVYRSTTTQCKQSVWCQNTLMPYCPRGQHRPTFGDDSAKSDNRFASINLW